jgi:hypothetical protein
VYIPSGVDSRYETPVSQRIWAPKLSALYAEQEALVNITITPAGAPTGYYYLPLIVKNAQFIEPESE